jgi:uncharacterized RDD family membrane protein YckC
MNINVQSLTFASKASFWKRSTAALIEALLIGILSFTIELIFDFNSIAIHSVNTVLWYPCCIILEYYWQGTIGKINLNIKVVGPNGERASLVNVIARNSAKMVTAFTFGHGYLKILAPHVMQTTHDELSRCYVVKR